MKKYGFTLLEIMISTSIMVVVLGMALSITIAATKQAGVNTLTASGQIGLIAVIEKIQEELGQSRIMYEGELADGTVLPVNDQIIVDPLNPDRISFRRVIGYNRDTYNTIWSDRITYMLVIARGEGNVPDGLDNNGNGFIDEYCLARVEGIDPNVDPFGFLTTQIYFTDPGVINVAANEDLPLDCELNGNLITLTLSYFYVGNENAETNAGYTAQNSIRFERKMNKIRISCALMN